MGDKNNKREFTRVPVKVPIELQIGGRTSCGHLTGNLSMKGLLVSTPEAMAEGTACGVRIVLGDGSAEMRAEARVVRAYPGAVALQFTRILGNESFEHLRRLVMYNAPDPEQAERELRDQAGAKPRR